MRFIKKFDLFLERGGASPSPAPSPGTKPTTTPSTPARPSRPDTIPTKRPSVDPAPKGPLDPDEFPKASEKDLAKRFIALMKKKGEDYKSLIDKKETE